MSDDARIRALRVAFKERGFDEVFVDEKPENGFYRAGGLRADVTVGSGPAGGGHTQVAALEDLWRQLGLGAPPQ